MCEGSSRLRLDPVSQCFPVALSLAQADESKEAAFDMPLGLRSPKELDAKRTPRALPGVSMTPEKWGLYLTCWGH